MSSVAVGDCDGERFGGVPEVEETVHGGRSVESEEVQLKSMDRGPAAAES